MGTLPACHAAGEVRRTLALCHRDGTCRVQHGQPGLGLHFFLWGGVAPTSRGTAVGDAAAAALAQRLGDLKQLKRIELYFQRTPVGNRGVEAIGAGLRELSHLQEVTLGLRGTAATSQMTASVRQLLMKPTTSVTVF
mmetsp:Transcript_47043/g.102314  ORF Transcript_47043/g.102314 Transcript_47043/m.102314 type:complete len:137 (+) Transcript_47043:21-431(+)